MSLKSGDKIRENNIHTGINAEEAVSIHCKVENFPIARTFLVLSGMHQCFATQSVSIAFTA